MRKSILIVHQVAFVALGAAAVVVLVAFVGSFPFTVILIDGELLSDSRTTLRNGNIVREGAVDWGTPFEENGIIYNDGGVGWRGSEKTPLWIPLVVFSVYPVTSLVVRIRRKKLRSTNQ